jgi:HprK-related kinase A
MELQAARSNTSPRQLRKTGVVYRTGPFLVRLRSDCFEVLHRLAYLYPETDSPEHEQVVNFHVDMRRPAGLRRWHRPQIRFFVDSRSPFEPYPVDHALPLLEWGLNWCIAMRAHQYLMLHAGAVERAGKALILPAMPGSGKSTLSAGLALRGWRLLSDEFGLIVPSTGAVTPLPRAVPLKNQSIGVIRAFAPDAAMGPLYPRTRKGDVAHLRPPGESLRRQEEPATATAIVFPRFLEGAEPVLQEIPRSLAFTRLTNNAFNYRLLGETGFRAMTALIRGCGCFSFVYGDLDTAIAVLDRFHNAR